MLVSTMQRDCESSRSLTSTVSRVRQSGICKLAEVSVRMVFRCSLFQSLCKVWTMSKLGLCGFLLLISVWAVLFWIGFAWFVFELIVETGNSRYNWQRTFSLFFVSIFDSSSWPASACWSPRVCLFLLNYFVVSHFLFFLCLGQMLWSTFQSRGLCSESIWTH